MAEKKTVNIVKDKPNVVEDIFAEAQQDVNDSIVKAAKSRIIIKLEERAKAQKVLSNIDREISELKIKISQDLGQ